jgi:dUTP pyrophosphatase
MSVKSITIQIRKMHPDAKIPTYSHDESAGFDIYSVEDVVIKPGETRIVKSGISLEVPPGKVVFIWDRSGLGVRGIHRFAGVIDSDYRGEYNIVLCNHGKEDLEIKKWDRIAQGVIQDYYRGVFEEVEELGKSERGSGWSHSTGR